MAVTGRCVKDTRVNLVDCTFLRNRVFGSVNGGNGGAISGLFWAKLTNCAFYGNRAGGLGGAIDSSLNTPESVLTNCVFVGNRAGKGGALSVVSGTYVNCILSCNQAASYGGGIFVAGGPQIRNSILWGNVDPTGTTAGAQLYMPTAMPTITHSCWQGSTPAAGSGTIAADPLFKRSPSPGPDGEWATLDDDYGDLGLRPGSPCLDAGNNAAVPTGITADLSGSPRFQDDPAVADCPYAPGTCGTAPLVDMGAYEAGASIVGDFDGDGDVDIADALEFAACGSGPAVPFTQGCRAEDLDHDGDVDQSDFGMLQRAYGNQAAS